MKKFFPLFSLLIISCTFLAGQYFFEFIDISAKPTGALKKINAHYESSYLTTKVKNLKGEVLDLPKLNSEIVILNFWASWCRPCLSEFKSIVELKKKYSNKLIRVIGINSDDDNQIQSVNKTIKKYKLNFDISLDAGGKILEKYMISAIPVSIIFHKGKVIEVSNGAKDFNSVETIKKLKKYLSK